MGWKKSLFLITPVLELLVNTLTDNEKYPVLTRDHLTIPIQMQLSQKPKTFSQFLGAFLKPFISFKYFLKKDDHHRFCNSETTNSENVII